MIRDVWEKEAKQRWDGQTHGRGLCLLIIDVLGLQGAFKPGRPRSPHPRFEFWETKTRSAGVSSTALLATA
jgi:hypothetical protein